MIALHSSSLNPCVVGTTMFNLVRIRSNSSSHLYLRILHPHYSTSSSQVTHLKTPDPDSVLKDLFKQYGFDNTHINHIVSSHPKLLLSYPYSDLVSKFRLLNDIGLSGSELVKVIQGNHAFFRKGHVEPSIKFLKELLGSDENVVKALRRCNWLLSCYAKRGIIESNVELLKRFCYSSEEILMFIKWNPRYVLLSTVWLEGLLLRVERELGISRGSPMFKYGVEALACVKKSTVEMKFDVLRGFGWSDSDIMTMVRTQPLWLRISEAKLRRGVDFFMKRLGYSSSYLASHPKLLSHSLEKRVIPRCKILKILQEKQLLKHKVTLYSVVDYTELEFLKNFVLLYKDEVEDIFEMYTKYVDN